MTVDRLGFQFSDLVAGEVLAHRPEEGVVDLRTPGGRVAGVRYRPGVPTELLRNLGEPYAAADAADLLTVGRPVFCHGIVATDDPWCVDARRLVFLGRGEEDYAFEQPDWWSRQLTELAGFYRRAQFGAGPIDYADYRTVLRLGGDKSDHHVQETDTISRLVYGMAASYLLSGNEDHLHAAELGTEYLREHMRFVDRDDDVVYWYHGIDVRGSVETKLFASEFGDDYLAVPAYEQIYALAGPTATYRITGDPRILSDVDATLRLFERYFHDDRRGGWYSHVDPLTLSPHASSLGPNRSRKNWNSVGDHAPAYLINLLLATGRRRHADMLAESFDLILRHFVRPGEAFVQERFLEDWTPDRDWGWQQDRAVVGHNLKIAWNAMRMDALRPDPAYRQLASSIALSMPALGSDERRGGWYDMVERAADAAGRHQLVWHDRKAWWQQEQAILAYLILAGTSRDERFRHRAREAAAYYNAFFLDHDEGGVYFNVLADGTPFLLGTERLKGSHSMSMYHAAELCLLATVYQRLLLRGEPLELWFRPRPDGFLGRVLRVAPDALPADRVVLDRVEIDGEPYDAFDPTSMTVALPDSGSALTVRVRLRPRTGLR